MQTNVFANNLEIASKAADGKAISAFPDPCWSPPAPSAGPVVIPYSNTVFAKDITNGTRTVFICGKEVAIEDHSYFATSTGNEAATEAFAKGTATHVIKGKAYFQSWSFDVVFEGFGVARHTDLTTHNHGSKPANTPPTYYMDDPDTKAKCKNDLDKLKKKCEHSEEKKKKRKKSKTMPAGKDDSNSGSWVLNHCEGLFIKPSSIKEFQDWVDDVNDYPKAAWNAIEEVAKNKIVDKLEREVAEFAAKKAAAFAARRGLTGWIPIVGQVIAVADLVYTGVQAYERVQEIKAEIAEVKETVDRLKQSAEKVRDTFKKYDIKNLTDINSEQTQALMSDVQTAIATADPCLRARKCTLVPYSKSGSGPANWAGKGCCPGQTGHHLLPDAMFRDPNSAARDGAFEQWKSSYSGKKAATDLKMSDMPRDKLPKAKCWEGYTESRAPTICLEGTSNNHGSHGAAHAATKALLADALGQKEMDYETARNRMSTMVHKTYGCNKECIDKQLDAYYKKAHKCGDLDKAKVTPHSGAAGDTAKTTGGEM
ncbi:PAAR-like domain-containing protein [Ralstonia solanacearum]|uniref:PAAR-like domain-containing protein n=1 Tax=Ralstonia solanacearum TaxID=305 RepID=UPI0009BFCC69|nr:PAAR-like domain-containing protein [Ralstonia solanacearum]